VSVTSCNLVKYGTVVLVYYHEVPISFESLLPTYLPTYQISLPYITKKKHLTFNLKKPLISYKVCISNLNISVYSLLRPVMFIQISA